MRTAKESMVRRAMGLLDHWPAGVLSEQWSEAARKAALEARQRKSASLASLDNIFQSNNRVTTSESSLGKHPGRQVTVLTHHDDDEDGSYDEYHVHDPGDGKVHVSDLVSGEVRKFDSPAAAAVHMERNVPRSPSRYASQRDRGTAMRHHNARLHRGGA